MTNQIAVRSNAYILVRAQDHSVHFFVIVAGVKYKPSLLTLLYRTLGYDALKPEGDRFVVRSWWTRYVCFSAHRIREKPTLHYLILVENLRRAYIVIALSLSKTVASSNIAATRMKKSNIYSRTVPPHDRMCDR